MRVFAYRDWDPDDFKELTPVPYVLNHKFPVDNPGAMCTSNIKNPFSSYYEKESAIEVYDLWNLEEFAGRYIRRDWVSRLMKIIEENTKHGNYNNST